MNVTLLCLDKIYCSFFAINGLDMQVQLELIWNSMSKTYIFTSLLSISYFANVVIALHICVQTFFSTRCALLKELLKLHHPDCSLQDLFSGHLGAKGHFSQERGNRIRIRL